MTADIAKNFYLYVALSNFKLAIIIFINVKNFQATENAKLNVGCVNIVKPVNSFK